MTRRWPFLLGLLWTAVIFFGFRIVRNYETTPGRSGAAPARWPDESRIPRALDRATLVMLAHPRCPCTRAGLEELSRIMARRRGRLQAHVLFYQPSARPDEWSGTSLWRAAAAVPGIKVWRDADGAEARRFAAGTSGQVLLYDSDGRLLFSGGITGLRGHVGDNAGSRALLALLARGNAAAAGPPVLGCALEGSVIKGGEEHASPIPRI